MINISRKELFEAIRPVIDPDLGYSIVDLGLIYDAEFKAEEKQAIITMTLTSPACPAIDFLIESIQDAVLSLENVDKAHVCVVWEPRWTLDCIKEEIRLELDL